MNIILVYALIFAFIQSSDAVQCPYGKRGFVHPLKECQSCVYFQCRIDNPDGTLNAISTAAGCPEDFFADKVCSLFVDPIKIINESGSNNVAFYNGDIYYVSGCSYFENGKECISKKNQTFTELIGNLKNAKSEYLVVTPDAYTRYLEERIANLTIEKISALPLTIWDTLEISVYFMLHVFIISFYRNSGPLLQQTIGQCVASSELGVGILVLLIKFYKTAYGGGIEKFLTYILFAATLSILVIMPLKRYLVVTDPSQQKDVISVIMYCIAILGFRVTCTFYSKDFVLRVVSSTITYFLYSCITPNEKPTTKPGDTQQKDE